MPSPHALPPQVGDTANLLLKKLVTATQDLGGSGGIFLTEAEANALYLKQLSNLGDLTNVATARTNLGLGIGDSPTFVRMTSTVATGTAPFTVASTTLVANLHAATADSVTSTAITDDTTTNATMYPTWVTANSGNLPLKVTSTKFSFNPSTGIIGLADAGGITSSGSIALTAGGAAKNITLTPSTSGYVLIPATYAATTGGILFTNQSAVAPIVGPNAIRGPVQHQYQAGSPEYLHVTAGGSGGFMRWKDEYLFSEGTLAAPTSFTGASNSAYQLNTYGLNGSTWVQVGEFLAAVAGNFTTTGIAGARSFYTFSTKSPTDSGSRLVLTIGQQAQGDGVWMPAGFPATAYFNDNLPTTGTAHIINIAAATNTVANDSGTKAIASAVGIGIQTLASSGSAITVTAAATLRVAGDMAQGSGMTLTNTYGLWNVGKSRLDGNTLLGGLAVNGTGALQFAAATTTAGGITFGTDVNFFRLAAGSQILSATGNAVSLFLQNSATGIGGNSDGFNLSVDASSIAYVYQKENAALVFGTNNTTRATFLSTGPFQLETTNTVRFGATAAATIGVSADTTAGLLTFTSPSSGGFSFATGVVASPGGIKRVTAQFDKANNTLANITGLSVALLASTRYRFRAVLFTTSNVASGVQAAVAYSGTVTDVIYEGDAENAGLITQARTTTMGNAVAAVTAVTAARITIEGSVLTNAAGNLTIQFANNTGANTSSVLIGSYMEVFGM